MDQRYVARTVQRKRNALTPPIPSELLDVEQILQGPDSDKWRMFWQTKDKRDQLFQGVVGPAGDRSIVLASSRMIDWWSGQLQAGSDG